MRQKQWRSKRDRGRNDLGGRSALPCHSAGALVKTSEENKGYRQGNSRIQFAAYSACDAGNPDALRNSAAAQYFDDSHWNAQHDELRMMEYETAVHLVGMYGGSLQRGDCYF